MPPHQEQGDARRQQILAFVRKFITANSYAPSLREISDGVGLSSTTATKTHLQVLHEQGYLVVHPGIVRAIALVDPAPDGWSRS